MVSMVLVGNGFDSCDIGIYLAGQQPSSTRPGLSSQVAASVKGALIGAALPSLRQDPGLLRFASQKMAVPIVPPRPERDRMNPIKGTSALSELSCNRALPKGGIVA